MKCEECQNDLLKIYKNGEVQWGDFCVGEDGELKEFDNYVGGEDGLFFCKKCKYFVNYYFGVAHDDTDEYVQMQEKISLDYALYILSKTLIDCPELIDFSALKEVCDILKINISDVIKNIAFEIVGQRKPCIIANSNVETNDEVPF